MTNPDPKPLTTLPGDIPGLLRRGSPVLSFGAERATIHAIEGERYWCALTYSDPSISVPITVFRYPPDLALDLTDPTGRAHAAWWARDRYEQRPPDHEWDLLNFARYGGDMTPKQIDLLAHLVLRLAGRETP